MKKNIAIVFVLLITATALAANKPKKCSREELGIHGDAIYMLEFTYNLHGGKNGGKQLVCLDSVVFDSRGNLQDKYRRNNGKYTWFSYYFDVNGYSLGWNEYDKNNVLTARTAYLNDNNGNCIERTAYINGHMTKRESSRYENNRLVEEQSYDDNGSMTEKRVLKYDNQGNNTETEFYGRDGEIYQKYIYKYDAKGNRVEWRFYDADEFLVALTTYYYDEHDNLIEESSFNYDEHLNWKHTYIYEYDEEDNWVRKTVYRNGTPYQVIEREIAFPVY